MRHGRARLCLVRQPGGGYIQGYLGQEATLCADSYLYNVLDKQRKWYGENRRRNINCELYRNRALVVPAVRFDRNHVHAYADVIVAAAPNAKRARQEYRVGDDALLDACAIASASCLPSATSWVARSSCWALGAATTTALMPRPWPSSSVRSSRRATLRSKQVFFAVPSTRWDEDFAKFEHVLANFPERNEESYAQVAARAAAARAAEQAQLPPRTMRTMTIGASTCNRYVPTDRSSRREGCFRRLFTKGRAYDEKRSVLW